MVSSKGTARGRQPPGTAHVAGSGLAQPFLAWPGGSPPGFLARPGGSPPGFLANPGGSPPGFLARPGGSPPGLVARPGGVEGGPVPPDGGVLAGVPPPDVGGGVPPGAGAAEGGADGSVPPDGGDPFPPTGLKWVPPPPPCGPGCVPPRPLPALGEGPAAWRPAVPEPLCVVPPLSARPTNASWWTAPGEDAVSVGGAATAMGPAGGWPGPAGGWLGSAIRTECGPAGGWTELPLGKLVSPTSAVMEMNAAIAPAISAVEATPPDRYCSARSIALYIGRGARDLNSLTRRSTHDPLGVQETVAARSSVGAAPLPDAAGLPLVAAPFCITSAAMSAPFRRRSRYSAACILEMTRRWISAVPSNSW